MCPARSLPSGACTLGLLYSMVMRIGPMPCVTEQNWLSPLGGSVTVLTASAALADESRAAMTSAAMKREAFNIDSSWECPVWRGGRGARDRRGAQCGQDAGVGARAEGRTREV